MPRPSRKSKWAEWINLITNMMYVLGIEMYVLGVLLGRNNAFEAEG